MMSAIERLPTLSEQPLEFPSLPQRIGYRLLNPYKNSLIPASWLRASLRTSRSPLIAESMVSPGGWRSMELIYRKQPPIDWLDRQALLDNPISMAARNRRKIVTQLIAHLIAQQPPDQHLNLLGVGSGPGWHIQTAIVEANIPASRATAYLIDLADDAFPYGRRLAANFGLQDSVYFIRGDARQIRETLPSVRVNIAKLVGIVEYLTDDQFIVLLQALHDIMVPEGSLVTHGLVDKYQTGPFLARVFQLRHHQRDAKFMTELLNRTGFHVSDCQYEPTGIHPIITAVRDK
jgi:hypothetical protein